MNTLAKAFLVCAGASLLAGCQSSPLKGWSFGKKRVDQRLAMPKTSGAVALEEGRAMLRDGRISAAAASFRIAMLDPATAAEANNGLAVAYAKVGRPDLAARYFRAAIELAPSDTRFAANLLRMQHSVMMARRAAAQASPALAQAAPAPEMPKLAAAQQVHRATRGEFHIRTRSDLAQAPRMAVVYRQSAPAPETQADTPDEKVPSAADAVLAQADKPKAKEYILAK